MHLNKQSVKLFTGGLDKSDRKEVLLKRLKTEVIINY